MTDLTKIILQIKKTELSDELLELMYKTIEKMYKDDEWIYAPVKETADGQLVILGMDIKLGSFLFILSESKYVTKLTSGNLLAVSIRKVFETYFDNIKTCSGIAINPGTEAEIILTKEFIDNLLLIK